MPDINMIRAEIELEPKLVDWRRTDILTLKRVGRSTTDAELILVRQLARLEDPIRVRNQLKAALPVPVQGEVLGGRPW